MAEEKQQAVAMTNICVCILCPEPRDTPMALYPDEDRGRSKALGISETFQ